MNLLRNKVFVICLAVLALVLLVRSFRPLWQRGRPSPRPAPAQTQAAAPTPTRVASNAPATSAAPPQAEAGQPAPGIELGRVGWSFDGAPRRDPFQVIGPGPTNLTRLQPPASELLTLDAIWWQSGTILAAINGEDVTEGDTIKGFRIENIGLERIWVNGPNGREQLAFDPMVSLRGITFKLGTGLDESFAGAKARLKWPYRLVNGVTNDVRADPGWEVLGGTVLQKESDGTYRVSLERGQVVTIRNVPLDLVDNERMPDIECKYIGTEQYPTTDANKKTVKAYDFGIGCSPPAKTIESLKRQNAYVLQQRREANERRIRLEMQEAEKGRASAQYMLGRRYLYGDGIAEDEEQARHWLEKAAAQGDLDAKATLLVLGLQK